VVELTRGQLVAWAAAAALVVFALVRLLAPGGQAGEAPPVRVGGSPSGESKQELYVHIAGAVKRPGLYRLPSAARVGAALERAGGPLRRADLAAVNLAAAVEDGQQIKVPRVGEQPAVASAGGAAGAGAAGAAGSAGAAQTGGAKVSLASATVEQLDQLDGIGPTLAKRIVQFRDEKGGFRSVDQLRDVEGIGEKRFAALREAVAP